MKSRALSIPLTIPQLAALLRTQFTTAERQELVNLMREPPAAEAVTALPTIADDLRAAITELKQAERGEVELQSFDDFLSEL